jgi:hypothetical protein
MRISELTRCCSFREQKIPLVLATKGVFETHTAR